jgi:hypothetical protein
LSITLLTAVARPVAWLLLNFALMHRTLLLAWVRRVPLQLLGLHRCARPNVLKDESLAPSLHCSMLVMVMVLAAVIAVVMLAAAAAVKAAAAVLVSCRRQHVSLGVACRAARLVRWSRPVTANRTRSVLAAAESFDAHC